MSMTGRRIGPEAILSAITAEQPAIESLLEELVSAPTLLGHEQPGQAIMRAAFADLGLEPREVVLDAQALRAHPGAAPFSWELSGKANVVARWGPPEARGGRSLILNGHICFGPHAETVHSIDERVYLPSVLQTAQALALFISEWCGLEPADS
ncbi:MAG: hypothetical protein ACR2L9_05880 [Solirubrobacteraceae bacterium]